MKYFLLIILIINFPVFSETIMLKNGNFISGTIKNFEDNKYTIIEDDKKYVIKKKNIDLILMNEYKTGIFDNEYKNFKYNCAIKKENRLFFIPKKIVVENSSSQLKNLVIISKKLIVDNTDTLIWLDTIKLKEKHKNSSNMNYIKICDNILRLNYRNNTRFPGEIKTIHSYYAYVQKMTTNKKIFGKSMRYMLKQMIIIKEDRAFVVTCQEKFRNFDKIEPEFDKIINSFKFIESLDTFSNLAYMYYFNKEYTKAIKYFRKAVELEPDNADLYNKLGIMYTFIGDFKKAKKNFEKGHELDISNKHIEYNNENTGDDNFTGLPFQ